MLKKVLKDIKRGREDGFPVCCVAFYSFFWGRLSDASQTSTFMLRAWSKLIGDPYHRLIDSDNIVWGRIPCPKCIVKDKLSLP